MRFSFSLLVTALVAGAHASNVVDLVTESFDELIGKGKPALVEFFAPWCGHCKNLMPIYEQLADAFSHAKDKVIIAKVDGDGAGHPLVNRYEINGYPTLMWFTADGTVEPFEAERDLDSLVAYVTSKTGVKSNIKAPSAPETVILDLHTFDDVVMDKSKNVLVSFTAPWCGHCKAMKPAYEKVAQTFKPESNCIVANIDANDAKNKDIAKKYDVSGFPTIKFFSTDNKDEPELYKGGRTEADFVKFLNEKCGTQRAVGGGLSDQAGRLPEFDALASKFFVATGDVRDSIFKEASVLAAKAGAVSKHYLRVMEKIVNGTEGYFEKESNRLDSILKKRSLSPSKLDEIKIKANILRAFVEEKAEEAQEKAESIAQKDTAEL